MQTQIDEIVFFEPRRARLGYKAIQSQGESRLVPNDFEESGDPDDDYPAVALPPDLYLKFAQIHDVDGAVAFANKFGLLEIDSDSVFAGIGGQPVIRWIEAARLLHHTFRIASAVDEDDLKTLGQYFLFHGQHIYFKMTPETPLSAVVLLDEPGTYDDPYASVQNGDYVHVAALHLKDVVAARLYGGIKVHADLALPSKSVAGRVSWGYQPRGILTAIWLQFGTAHIKPMQFKKCLACGRLFRAGNRGKRIDSDTCSAACRKAVWVKRQVVSSKKGAKHAKPTRKR